VSTNSASNATAYAAGGAQPVAYTSAGSNTYAAAVGGEVRSVVAEVNAEDAIHQSLVNDNESWAIAYVAGGQYSIAVATKDSASAYSSTYGAGTAGASFTADDVWAAALTWAQAYASANNLSATAWAAAGASASANTSGGSSVAASVSRAGATIRLELVQHGSSSSSSGAVSSIDCKVTVTDWEMLKRVKPEQRARYLKCECPVGWQHPAGAGRFSCVRGGQASEAAAPIRVALNGKSAATSAAKPAPAVVSNAKGKPVLVASNTVAKSKGKPVATGSKSKAKGKPVAVAKGKAKAKPAKGGGLAGFFRAIFTANKS
jgi:hypothetical protein